MQEVKAKVVMFYRGIGGVDTTYMSIALCKKMNQVCINVLTDPINADMVESSTVSVVYPEQVLGYLL
jgi:hypothetical protein